MNLRKTLLLLVCGINISTAIFAQEKYSEVRIPISDPQAKKFVFDKLGVDHYNMDGENMLITLNKSEMNILRQSGYRFSVEIDDVVANTIEVNKNITPEESIVPFQGNGCNTINNIITTPSLFGTGGSLRLGAAVGNPGYFTYAEMNTIMLNLATAYPTLVSRITIGTSSEGRIIYGVKISDNVTLDQDEPEVLYTALQHAREAISGTSMIFFMQYLAQNYASDIRIRELVDNREIFIIPCVNPDGYTFNYSGAPGYPTSGGGLWRKNRRNTGGGASNIGVDLNRNYSVDWGNCLGASASCGSTIKTDETYIGTSAFSEPETQALRTFVLQRRFVNAIDQHAFGSYYSLPFGRPTLHAGQLSADDINFYSHVPALMGMYNGHRSGNSPETVNYEVAGGIKDWLLLGEIGSGTGPKGKVYGMTGEAGGGVFWAPVNQIIALCKELTFQNLQLAYAAGSMFELQDKSDIGLSQITGNLSFEIKRIGVANNPVTVSIIPLENIQSVGTSKTTSIASYYGEYRDSISYTISSAVANGGKIKFVWRTESGGISTYDTVTKFYNPLTLFADNMEGNFADNWISSTGWAFTTASAFSGIRSVAESPTGNYTHSSTRTLTYRNTVNLVDALEAYLTFYTRHSAENFFDKLQIQISTNGTSFTPICGSYTVSEPNTTSGGTLGGQPALTGVRLNWTKMTFDLSSFKNNANVSIRFVFTSNGNTGNFAYRLDDGFYIDDVKIIKSVNNVTLPVNFVNFYTQLQQNKTVKLDWEAYVDAEHDYFEVERSNNGINFTSLSKVTGLPPYKSFDYSPSNGVNYYRIKQVDKNGAVSYSTINKVVVSDKLITSIYPNPVKDQLSVKMFNNGLREIYAVIITDAAGKIVYNQKTTLEAGSNNLMIDMKHLAAQNYFLKVSNSNNETLVREQIIKL